MLCGTEDWKTDLGLNIELMVNMQNKGGNLTSFPMKVLHIYLDRTDTRTRFGPGLTGHHLKQSLFFKAQQLYHQWPTVCHWGGTGSVGTDVFQSKLLLFRPSRLCLVFSVLYIFQSFEKKNTSANSDIERKVSSEGAPHEESTASTSWWFPVALYK